MVSDRTEFQVGDGLSRSELVKRLGGVMAGVAGGALLAAGPAQAQAGPPEDYVFNIRGMGVRGDGSDETAAIQTAIDRVAAAGGGVLWFPAGVYGFGPALTLFPGVMLQGEGWSSILRVLSSPGDRVPVIHSTANGAGRFGGARDLRLESALGTDGMRWDDCDSVAIERVWFTGLWGQTMKIVRGRNHLVAHCLRESGVQSPPDSFLTLQHVIGARVLHNRAMNCHEGVDLNNFCENILVEGNWFENIQESGIEMTASRNVTVRGNVLINCNFSATQARGAIVVHGNRTDTGEGSLTENVWVEGNAIIDPRWTGVLVTSGLGITRRVWVQDNAMMQSRSEYEGTAVGIKLSGNCRDVWIARNGIEGRFLRGFFGMGLSGQTSTGVTIADNRFAECRAEALYLAFLASPTLRDNRVTRCGQALGKSGIEIQTTVAGRARISGGISTGSPRFGIRVASNVPAAIVVEDVDLAGNGLGPLDPGNGNIAVRDCPDYVTRRYGTATVADGGTIAHGLVRAPASVSLTPVVTGRLVSVTARNNQTITVALRAANGSPVTVAEGVHWMAETPF